MNATPPATHTTITRIVEEEVDATHDAREGKEAHLQFPGVAGSNMHELPENWDDASISILVADVSFAKKPSGIELILASCTRKSRRVVMLRSPEAGNVFAFSPSHTNIVRFMLQKRHGC